MIDYSFLLSWQIYVVMALVLVSAIAKAVQDGLQTKYDVSVFTKAKNQSYWNPLISWKRKWKNGDKAQGERFWLSSTWLVGLTDAWHLFGTIRDGALFICVPVLSGNYWSFLLYPVYRGVFHVFYHYAFKKK